MSRPLFHSRPSSRSLLESVTPSAAASARLKSVVAGACLTVLVLLLSRQVLLSREPRGLSRSIKSLGAGSHDATHNQRHLIQSEMHRDASGHTLPSSPEPPHAPHVGTYFHSGANSRSQPNDPLVEHVDAARTSSLTSSQQHVHDRPDWLPQRTPEERAFAGFPAGLATDRTSERELALPHQIVIDTSNLQLAAPRVLPEQDFEAAPHLVAHFDAQNAENSSQAEQPRENAVIVILARNREAFDLKSTLRSFEVSFPSPSA
jgi:hypothetical protein